MNPGDILDNRYQILERLGAGGMGEVFKATHLHLGATRVIKVIHSHISGNADASERFIREARTSTKVHHQNVATMHDFSQLADGSHYMVWEFIDGENLAQRLRARGTLPPRHAIHLIVQALHGLEAIHRAGIVHRDISPENLMITTADDTIKIIDLGVAKVEDAAATSQTRTGMFVGKLRYASPEQLGFIPEGEKIDGRTDIYATAMVLVELLTGRPPYEAKSPHEYFMMHANPAPLKPVELPAELPGSAALKAVIEKALARDRNDRYGTAREFANALEEVERTLSASHNSATMAIPLDGDATLRPGQRLATTQGFTQPDALHAATVITGAGTTPPPPPPNSAATLLTPLPQSLPQSMPQATPQAFQAPVPKQGSIVPLLIVGLIVLLAGGTVAGLLLWPIIKKQTATVVATNTAPPTQTSPPSTVAESEVTVNSDTTEPVTQTIPTATIVETDTDTATPGETAAPVTETREAVRPKPPVPVETKPRPNPREEEPAPAEEEVPSPPASYPAGTYVDGGDDEDANERALANLRRQLQGTKRVALRAGGLQVEVMRAIREFQPDLEFETNADVVIRFAGTAERRARGIKRRAAVATVEKNGRVIFRYQLPDELYRLGDSAPEAFARILSQAFDEE
jgi:serine/threonine-protein kinase